MKSSNGFKVCSGCKNNIPITEFHKNKTQPDGLNNWCKNCLMEFRKSYKEKKHEYDKQYSKIHSEKKRQIAKNWYNANREYAKKKHMEYYRTHPEIIKAYYQTEDYKQKHRELAKKQKAKRREMGYFKLWNNPFPTEIKIDWHHLNDMLVIPMPKKIHSKCSHLNPKEHRERCNIWLYYLYGVDIDKLLSSSK